MNVADSVQCRLVSVINDKIVSRSKQNDHLPIAYNTSIVSTLVKQSQQNSQLNFYDQFVRTSLNTIQAQAVSVASALDAQHEEFLQLQELAKQSVVDVDCADMVARHSKY